MLLLPVIYIQQTGNENTQNYQVEVVILILQQNLVTNLQGKGKGRINSQTLGVKGLTFRHNNISSVP